MSKRKTRPKNPYELKTNHERSYLKQDEDNFREHGSVLPDANSKQVLNTDTGVKNAAINWQHLGRFCDCSTRSFPIPSLKGQSQPASV